MFDGKAFGEQMVEVVRQYVDDATAPLRREIEELKAKAAIEGPAGKDGSDGANGADGRDVDMDAVLARVDDFLKAIPAPENGKDGRDGVDGKDGEAGPAGNDGRDGADGVGLAGAMIDRDGELNVTLTNGEVRKLGAVVGKDGSNGVDGIAGAPGQSWQEMDLVRTGPRTIEMSFQGGDQRHTYEIEFPIPIYQGVFAEGQKYVEGDMVTWAGSLWHCNDETDEKPGDGAKSWTLAAKRGRDGKDFAGPQTKPGKVSI